MTGSGGGESEKDLSFLASRLPEDWVRRLGLIAGQNMEAAS